VLEAFRLVFTNRTAIFYGLAGMFLFGALFGFISSSQQVYVEIYGLGPYFPVAFAAMAALMAVASFLNSRIVRIYGMRRLSHLALLVFVAGSVVWLTFSLIGFLPLWLFFPILGVVMFMFGWASSNMNSLSMEPLGAVAGTASSVFGFIQTVGGAVLGTTIGQSFNGTLTPIAIGYLSMGVAALVCVLIAERGKLFGVSKEYAQPEAAARH
jgi:DHA1 family bicyclomycin/chloramphenicol resistance-like MFS transporter